MSGPNRELRMESLPAVRAALKELHILKHIYMLCNYDLMILLLIVDVHNIHYSLKYIVICL